MMLFPFFISLVEIACVFAQISIKLMFNNQSMGSRMSKWERERERKKARNQTENQTNTNNCSAAELFVIAYVIF